MFGATNRRKEPMIKNKLPILTVIIPIAFIFFGIGKYTQTQKPQQTQTDSLRYKNNPNYELQIGMYDIYKTRQADIVMLGNSLTHGASWNELLGRTNVVERGIPSDILQGFLARMQYVYKLNPKICFVLGGLNDIYGWIPVEQVYADYIKVITGLQQHHIMPVIQSTVYAGKEWGKSWGTTPEINAGRNIEVAKLNKLLSDYAKKNNIDYIDLNSKLMTRDNFLNPIYTWDGVHFNSRGFKIWGTEVDKVLKRHNM